MQAAASLGSDSAHPSQHPKDHEVQQGKAFRLAALEGTWVVLAVILGLFWGETWVVLAVILGLFWGELGLF